MSREARPNGGAGTTDDEEGLRRTMLRLFRGVLDAERVEFVVERGGELVVEATEPPAVEPRTYHPLQSLVGQACAAWEPCVIDDLADTRSSASSGPGVDADAPRSLCCAPVGDYGVLVAMSTQPDRFDSGHRSAAEDVASCCATAMAREPAEGSRLRANGSGRDPDDTAARLDEVADIIAHDLINHLNVARGNLELGRTSDDPTHLDRAASAIDRVEELVNEVVVLARTGRLAEELEAISLDEVAEAAWADIPTAEAELTVEAGAVIRANERSARHLFENLFRNAIEHAGPTVSVRVGLLDDGFFVEDDGPGIPEADRERVFESGYGTGKEGTGLGLAIVDWIVTDHGWTISIHEGTDGGARFEIEGVSRADIDS